MLARFKWYKKVGESIRFMVVVLLVFLVGI